MEGSWHSKWDGASCLGEGLMLKAARLTQPSIENKGGRNSFQPEEEILSTRNFSFTLTKIVSAVLVAHLHTIGCTVT